MTHFDTVVVGAGLAGLQCARRLGEAGLRILLVDAKPSVDRSVHTTGIFVRRTLEDFDLPEECLGPPVRDVVIYSPKDIPLSLSSAHDEFRVGRMGALYTRWLEACIQSGVEWAPGTRYVSSWEDGDGSCVELNTGGVIRRVQTRFVIGADGATSRVARDLGLDENKEWIVGVEDVFHGVRMDSPPTLHCWLDPVLAPGYIAWVVSDGEEMHVGVGGYARGFRPVEALDVFRARVGERFGLANQTADERRGGRIPVGGVLKNIANKRGLLTGDAAGAVSPLTAGGLDPCLRLSAFAARVTGDFIATRNPDVLSPYSGARFRTYFRTRIAMRRTIAAIRSPLLAEAACALLRTPPMRKVAEGVFFGSGSFPDVDRHP